MESILEESELAIKSMEIMKKASQEQNEAVNITNKSFSDIANGIESIIEKIKEVDNLLQKCSMTRMRL
jgi:methyl-accepting chemotaxis protein